MHLTRLTTLLFLLVPFTTHAAEELDTPFVTTPPGVMGVMLEMANVGPGVRLIDLGSGDGRIVIAAAQMGAEAVGYEIDPKLVEQSRVAAQRAGVAERTSFRTQDLFEADLSGADAITMYLLPDVNARLRPKLFATLHPGARIVSHDYDLGEWRPDRTVEVAAPEKRVDRRKTSRVHFWLVPARIDGVWQGTAGDGVLRIDLRQRYQRVSGSATLQQREYVFADQTIEGRRLLLRLTGRSGAPSQLTLVATGDALVGRLEEGGRVRPVVLRR